MFPDGEKPTYAHSLVRTDHREQTLHAFLHKSTSRLSEPGGQGDTASNTNITDTNSAEKTMAQGKTESPMEIDNDVNSKDTNSVTNVVEGRADKSSEKASEKAPEDQTVVQDLPPSLSELTLCGHPRRRQIGLTSVRELQEEITSNTHEGKVGKAH